MKKVVTSAPGKLMLFGEHSVVYGYPCIVTAVDQRLYITVEENGENFFELDAPDLGLKAYSKKITDLANDKLPKAVRFIETCYKLFLDKYPQEKTIHVHSKSEFSSSFGFGSSSASTVAFAKAISEFYGVNLSNDQLFDLCYQTVLEVQGVGSGFDIAAAIWGGTIYYLTPKNKKAESKVVEELSAEELPLIVGYTGIKADTATLVRMVQGLRSNNETEIDQIFDEITEIVEKAKELILASDWTNLGELMNQNQKLLKQLKVSSVELETLIKASLDSGALGAKLSGAGGGDCMLALADENQRKAVETNITNVHGEIMKVKLNAPGVRLEK